MKKRDCIILCMVFIALAGAWAQQDYDGDGWIGGEDQPPILFGEYIADIPSLRLEFDATIEPGIEIKITSTQTTTDYYKEFDKTEKTVNYTVSSNKELKSNFSAGISGAFGLGTGGSAFKLTGGSLNLNAGVEYKRTETWKRTTTDEMRHFIEEYYEKKSNEEITVDDHAGFLRTQLKFTNLSHFPADLKITNIRAQAISYNPDTGLKMIFAEQTLSGEILLYSGSGNNSATRFIEFTGINTYDMEKAFERGDMFDVEISGDYLAASIDGTIDWRGRISTTLSRTMWVKVDYGDANNPVVRQVAIQARDGGPLTLEKALIEMYGPENVDFDYHSVTGERIIKRIMHRTNRHADRDYNSLSLDEQNEYGRWIVGYSYGPRNMATTFTIDSTPLYQGDIIGIYFLTKNDFQESLPIPDKSLDINITSDYRSSGNGMLVIDEPVKPGDQFEMDVNNYFTIYKQGTQSFSGTHLTEYGILINPTFYYKIVDLDNDLYVPVPDLNSYGLKVSFGTSNPMTWYDIEDLSYKLISRSDFPEYKYTIRFTVTESMLNGLSQGVLRIAQDKLIDGKITIGVTGRNIAGDPFKYLYEETNEVRSADVKLKWFKHNPDLDADGFQSIAYYGSDWSDNDITVHPGAAELWDAKDNNQDGSSEMIEIQGPRLLIDAQSGLYTAQVQNWSGSQPSINWYTSILYSNGTTGPWQDAGSGTSKTITMPANCAGFDIKIVSRLYMYDPVIRTNRWFELTHHKIVSNNKPVLKGWWKLDGNYNDSSGNNHTGTPKDSPVFVSGRIHQAVNLDGSNDYIQIGDYTSFNNVSQFTLAAWIYPESAGNRTIIAKVNPNRDFVLKLTSAGQLQAHFAHSAKYYSIYSDETIPLNTWSHVAATWDGRYWRLYLNGNEIKSADYNGIVPPHTGTRFGIGTMNWYDVFDGKIDDVRVYEGAWNEPGIKGIYEEAPPELMGWWKLDGNYSDSSGNNCTGTPVNGPVFAGGCIGQAVSLDGTDDHIRIPNYSLFNNLPEFSLTAWIYPNAYNRSNTIISKVNPNRDFVLKLTSTGKLQAHFAQGSTYYTITSTQTIPLMKWSHVTATWDGRYWRLYLDGKLIKEADHIGHTPPHTGTRLGIGTMNWSEVFAGLIDDVRIYRGVLHPVSIWNIYDEAPKPLSCSIIGPRYIPIPQKGAAKIIKTWTADAEGGTPPYTFTWYKKSMTGSYYQLCQGTYYSETFTFDGYGSDTSFMLKLETRDASGNLTIYEMEVYQDRYPIDM